MASGNNSNLVAIFAIALLVLIAGFVAYRMDVFGSSDGDRGGDRAGDHRGRH